MCKRACGVRVRWHMRTDQLLSNLWRVWYYIVDCAALAHREQNSFPWALIGLMFFIIWADLKKYRLICGERLDVNLQDGEGVPTPKAVI